MMNVQDILRFLNPENQNLPKITLKKGPEGASLLIIPVFEDEKKDFPDSAVDGRIVKRIWVGPKSKMTPRKIRRFFGQAYLSSLGSKPTSIAIQCPDPWVKWAGVGIHVAALDPAMLKATSYKKQSAPEVILVGPKSRKELEEGLILAEGKNLMRILGTLPPNVLHPQSYAELIVKLAKEWKVKCDRVSRSKLEKYELLNSVSRGSGHDSELLVITLNPAKGATKTSTAVFGKGLCFDSGGMNSKGEHMKFMKEDMAGSASLLGTILNIVKGGKKIKETIHFFFPLAINTIGEDASRPDDIWIAGDGQSVEINNTDAEGRLVLGDAICYAKNNFKDIRRYITIATLTGSCMVALGDVYTGVLCNPPRLGRETEALGNVTGEQVHVGPFDMEYDDYNSPYADLTNYGDNPREAGWIKGAIYLYRFLPKNVDFIHFDIAGSIDMYEKGKPWRRKGLNSGVGVGLLTELLRG